MQYSVVAALSLVLIMDLSWKTDQSSQILGCNSVLTSVVVLKVFKVNMSYWSRSSIRDFLNVFADTLLFKKPFEINVISTAVSKND